MKVFYNILVLLLCVSVSAFVYADELVFVGSNSSWTTASNWQNVTNPSNPHVPTNGDDVTIPSGKHVICSATKKNGNEIAKDIRVESGGILEVSGVGSRTAGGLVVEAGGSVIAKDGLNLGNTHGYFDVYGNVNVMGDLSCGEINIHKGASFACSGSVNKNCTARSILVDGDAVFGGYVHCNPLEIDDDGDAVFKGQVNIGDSNGELILSGSVQFESSILLNKLTASNSAGEQTEMLVDDNLIYMWNFGNSQGNEVFKSQYGSVLEKYVTSINVVEWNGTRDSKWSNKSNWKNGTLPTETSVVYINKGAYSPVIDDVSRVVSVKSIGIADGATLTINPGSSLYVKKSVSVMKGNYTNTVNALVINHRYDKSASFRVDDGDVVLLDGAEKSIYNRVRINRTFQTNITYYVGSSTTEGGIDLASSFKRLNAGSGEYDDFLTYDPVNEKYSAGTSFRSIMEGAATYLCSSDESERTITQVGSICNSKNVQGINLRLYKEGSNKEDFGWNLLSNPFQFAFPLDNKGQFIRSKVQFVGFRHYDSKSNAYKQYVYSFETNVSLPFQSEYSDVDSKMGLYLAPQQAFFVKLDKDVIDKGFEFNPAPVPAGSSTIKGATLKSSKLVDDVLYLSLNSDKNGEDQTALVFRDGGTLNANPVDANKKMESVKNNQIYLMKDDAEYAIGFYPEMKSVLDEVLPLGVIVAQGSSVATVKALNLDEFASDADVYLYDIENNESYNMREQESVDFAVESGKRIEGRFAIGIKSNKSLEAEGETEEGTMTGVKENSIDVAILVAGEANGAKVSLVGAEKATVNVYDLAGRLVVKSEIGQGENHVIFGQAGGFYLVEVVAGNVTKSAKIAIK